MAILPSQLKSAVPHGGRQLFHGTETTNTSVIGLDGNPASGNLWVFKYQHGGNVMIQRYDTAPGTWGDVVSH